MHAPAFRKFTHAPRDVVLVDDDQAFVYTTSRVLTEHRWTVHTASRGRDALDLISIVRPQLVLLDLNLPDLDGFATCALIRSWEWSRTTVIAAISGLSDTASITRALSGGFDLYLQKPLNEQRLTAVINHPAFGAPNGAPVRS